MVNEPLRLRPPELGSPGPLGRATREDANSLVRRVSTDVLYLDPRAPFQEGTQPGSIEQLFKAGGSYSFNNGIKVGGTFRWNSGTVASRTENRFRRNLHFPAGVSQGQMFHRLNSSPFFPIRIVKGDRQHQGQSADVFFRDSAFFQR